jgi:hypothetical protein
MPIAVASPQNASPLQSSIELNRSPSAAAPRTGKNRRRMTLIPAWCLLPYALWISGPIARYPASHTPESAAAPLSSVSSASTAIGKIAANRPRFARSIAVR